MRQTKTLEIKAAGDEGAFEAVIATMDVVDSDGDIVLPGSLDGKIAPLVPAHNQSSVPLGKAQIEEKGNQAIAKGQFNLEVGPALDWFKAIKFDIANGPALQEWSWGYFPIDASFEQRDGVEVRLLKDIDVHEISPVLRGASVGTRTISAKSATKSHKTDTSDAPWDAGSNLLRLKDDFKANEDLFAWDDGEFVGFPHHFVDHDGNPGAASTRACLAGIAVINGSRGAWAGKLPIDSKAVYDHLAGHLKDAGIDAPELTDDVGFKLVDQIQLVRNDLEATILRIRETSDARQKRGQKLADDTTVGALEMATAFAELQGLERMVKTLVSHVSPDDQVSRAVAAWERHLARSVIG